MLDRVVTKWRITLGSPTPDFCSEWTAHIVPEGGVEIVVPLSGNRISYRSGLSDVVAESGTGIVIGPCARLASPRVRASGNVATISLGYGEAAGLLGCSPILLRDRAVAMDDIDQTLANQIRDAIENGFENVIERLSGIFETRRRRASSPTMALALQQMHLRSGAITPAELSRNLGISPRTLQRCFEDQLGPPPSVVIGLARVAAARRALLRNSDLSLAQLALSLGYYDQSHFSRHFSAVTGKAPGKAVALPNVAFLQD
jgi:AraC-like DNA-binding protein